LLLSFLSCALLEEIKTNFLYCCIFEPIQRRHTYFWYIFILILLLNFNEEWYVVFCEYGYNKIKELQRCVQRYNGVSNDQKGLLQFHWIQLANNKLTHIFKLTYVLS
jgi:hypothetical protein